MILIFVEKTTNRVRYAFDVIFKDVLGIPYEVTTDRTHFLNTDAARISYGGDQLADELHFGAGNLLFEKGITKQSLTLIEEKELRGLFPQGNQSLLSFDPFASTFYFVSRYEEYLPSIRDQYGRYQAEDSFAFRKGLLEKPLVNQYACYIKDLLSERYPALRIPVKKYSFMPTYDVDSAYAYLHKGLVRSVGGYLKSIGQFDLQEIADRTKVLMGLKADPYDSFDYQIGLHQKYGLAATYFILLGNYDEYDKNISHDISAFQRLIKSISDHSAVGIHPSFLSNQKPIMLKKEIQRLSDILNKDIIKSRQHFLKLDIPITYHNLIEEGITEDYTMGYAAHVGFRASICSSYHFYNIDQEVKTNLKIFPFALMDATFQYYLNSTAEQAIKLSVALIQEIKQVNGTFISLWHNNSLSEENEWVGWRKVYEAMIKAALPHATKKSTH